MRSASVFDLLVGDVVPIVEGDKLPGDCILLEGKGLTCDESNLTGESAHVFKQI